MHDACRPGLRQWQWTDPQSPKAGDIDIHFLLMQQVEGGNTAPAPAPPPSALLPSPLLVAVHCGAGSHARSKEPLYNEAMREACRAAAHVLMSGRPQSPCQAACRATCCLEVHNIHTNLRHPSVVQPRVLLHTSMQPAFTIRVLYRCLNE